MKEHNEINMNSPVKNRTKEQDEYKRLCDKLNIVDLFVSIQGEGKYVGVPSLFIRVSGCNLRCCFKDSICDTAYSSFNPEKGKFDKDDVVTMLRNNPCVMDIVITGGEPLMFGEVLDDLIEYVCMVNEMDYRITVETNGTFGPLKSVVDLYSISPKLCTSVPVAGKTYTYTHEGRTMTKTFSNEEVERYNITRHNPAAIASLMEQADFQLKFVYSGPESLTDIDNLLDEIMSINSGFEPEDVMLMPEGITPEQLDKNTQEAVEICIKRGWRFTDRLHIRIWGDKRGV